MSLNENGKYLRYFLCISKAQPTGEAGRWLTDGCPERQRPNFRRLSHHKYLDPHYNKQGHYRKPSSQTIECSSFRRVHHDGTRNIQRVLQCRRIKGHDGTHDHTHTDKFKAPSMIEGLGPVRKMTKSRGTASDQHLPTKQARMSAQINSAQTGRTHKVGQGGVRSWAGLGLGYELQHQLT